MRLCVQAEWPGEPTSVSEDERPHALPRDEGDYMVAEREHVVRGLHVGDLGTGASRGSYLSMQALGY